MIIDEFKGKDLSYNRYQVECVCSTKFTFDYVDVKKHKVKTRNVIECPCCKKKHYLNTWELIKENSCVDVMNGLNL